MGPIYHYVERRIRAHIFVSFIALQMKVALTKKLREIDEEASYSEVLSDLSRMRAVKVNIGGERLMIRIDPQDKAKLAFKAVKMMVPSKILARLE